MTYTSFSLLLLLGLTLLSSFAFFFICLTILHSPLFYFHSFSFYSALHSFHHYLPFLLLCLALLPIFFFSFQSYSPSTQPNSLFCLFSSFISARGKTKGKKTLNYDSLPNATFCTLVSKNNDIKIASCFARVTDIKSRINKPSVFR